MSPLTPLERMFVEEFCRFATIDARQANSLRVSDRDRNPVGFMSAIERSSVPSGLRWTAGVFSTPRVAVVGPDRLLCGTLLFFDKETGFLDAIEGFVYGEVWPTDEAPAFWSEAERAIGRQGRR